MPNAAKNNNGLKRSVCPYDCPDTCGLLVEVAGGKAVKVRGDANHPYTKGALCAKMINYEKIVHSQDRLTTPLMRTGEKGAGKFRPVSWDEATGMIKTKWEGIITKYGAQAILPYSYAGTMGLVQRNAGHAFFHRLGASRLERTICSAAKDYGFKAVMGESLTLSPDEIVSSDFIILWGNNAAAVNIHILNCVRKAKRRGAKVWVVETYQSPTAAIADETLLVRPGSDGALALGIMHVLARENLIDGDFIKSYVQGFDKLKDEILPLYPPETVAQITGCPPETIERFAKLYGQSSSPFISLGSGLSRYGNGAMTVRTITCLPAIVGAWRKTGGGLIKDINTKDALPVTMLERQDFLPKPARIINMNQLGHALNEITSPPIMSLYVYSSNPAAIAPDQNAVLRGLCRGDLFTVVHERFMTDTALYADLVLPATTSLEHADIYRSYGHYCLQCASAIIDPVGHCKSNWEVFRLLAEVMGFDEPFFRQSADDIIGQMLENPGSWLMKADIASLKNGLPVELPLNADYKTTYRTTSGKIEIYNPKEKEALPRYLEPHGDNAPFWLVNAPSVYSLNSSFNELPELVAKKAPMSLMMNPADAALKKLSDGEKVIVFNIRGEVVFFLKITPKVPPGVVVTEGVFSLKDCPGNRSVNALTSQRLTDNANASTFYDTKVDVRSAAAFERTQAE